MNTDLSKAKQLISEAISLTSKNIAECSDTETTSCVIAATESLNSARDAIERVGLLAKVPKAANAMKWIKFLKDYDVHKAGEIVNLDATEAAVLVKMGQAEEAQEPPWMRVVARMFHSSY